MSNLKADNVQNDRIAEAASLNTLKDAVIVRTISFPSAHQIVTVAFENPYIGQGLIPKGYKYRVVDGDRKALIRKAGTDWETGAVYLLCDTDDITADVALFF